MKRSRYVVGFITIGLLLCLARPAFSAREYSPEIKKYLKEVKEKKKQEAKQEREAKKADPFRRLRPYQTLDEIYAELDKLVAEHPDILSGGTYGKSVDGRDLRWVRLNTGKGERPEILVSGNIHAQELAGGQMVMALLHALVDEYGQDCDITRLADGADIYFIPVLNPDGMAKASEQQARYGVTGFVRKNADKVDLNRNFPYPPDGPDNLKDEAGSPKKRSQTHRGPMPLSEPETASLIRFIDQHHFLLSLNYHTSGGLILYSPGTYPEPFPDTETMREIALAYQSRQFDKYRVEPAIDLYPTLGDLDDYLYHHYGILAFTVEVGKNTQDQVLSAINGSISPIFWAYNVYRLDQEKANNVPAALEMIRTALKLCQEPELIKWQPPKEQWVGEPALKGKR
jgi:predicted deacylase